MFISTEGNTLTAYGYIWDGDGMNFINALQKMESEGGEIKVRLHTYGGSVFDGNLIHNALKDSKADIRIEIIGVAASMGGIITLSREKVYMVDNGYLMLHAPSGYTSGNALEHEHTAKLLRSMESNFLKKLKAKTGKATNEVKKWLEGDNWFDAETALAEGLIAGIIDAEADIEKFSPEGLDRKEIYNRFAAVLFPENPEEDGQAFPQSAGELPVNEINNQPIHNNMKIIAEHLGLDEKADDQKVLAAIEAKETELVNAQAKLTNLEAKYKDLEKAETIRQTAELENEIKAAIKDGRIDANAEATIKELSFESAMKLLKGLPKRQKVAEGMADDPKAKFEALTWDEMDKKGMLAELKASDSAYFAERYEKEFGKPYQG